MTGVLASAVLLAAWPASADPNTQRAHAIANRFAEDAQRAETARQQAAQRQAQQRREQAARVAKAKAHEAEMLARARAEADERRKLEEEAARLDALRAAREAKEVEAARRIAAEEARRAEETRKAEEVKRAAEALRLAAEEARKAEVARAAAEAHRLAEAARAEDARRVAQAAEEARQAAQAAEETKRVAALRKAEEERQAEEARQAEAARNAREARRIADLEADAEIARVAERLHQIRQDHLAQRAVPTADTTTDTITGTIAERRHEPSSGPGRITDNEGFRDIPLAPPRAGTVAAPRSRASEEPAPPATRARFDGRVTVLLKMEPRYRRGRRYEHMDPVLCMHGGCYVSNGPDEAATFLAGHRAVRFGNAIGRRAGACNRAYTCVFRNVDVGALPATLQPVDIRIVRHDRREPERITTLSRCRANASDRMACTGAIHGDGYTLWVIPETVAEELPPEAFEMVLDGGFMDSAEVDPKLNPWADRW